MIALYSQNAHVYGCVCVCVCVCMCVCVLRIVCMEMDKILRFTNTFIFINITDIDKDLGLQSEKL